MQAALTAILEWGEADPSRLIPTCAGTSLPGSALTTVTAVAPARAFLEAFFAEPENLRNLGIRANHISLVLEIVYGETRLVLAGDLPDVDNKQASLSEGMSVVVGRAPRLANHQGMKLPHHGSWMATCDALMEASPSSRYWCLTPFNSHSLPDLYHPRGLSHLLGKQAEIHLTALAAPQDRQFSRPSPPLTLEQLQEATRSAKESADPFLAGAQELTMTECTGLEPIWCCAFDDRGRVRGRWRGNAAVLVTGPN
ncbi:hypothetical protein DYH09_21725 [bacterium CPR1]|nr:hypothetical protein [bacterium CPR1]